MRSYILGVETSTELRMFGVSWHAMSGFASLLFLPSSTTLFLSVFLWVVLLYFERFKGVPGRYIFGYLKFYLRGGAGSVILGVNRIWSARVKQRDLSVAGQPYLKPKQARLLAFFSHQQHYEHEKD